MNFSIVFTGFYCPEMTGFNLLPCPTGTFSPNGFLSSSNECLSCSSGSYCNLLNSTIVTGQCQGGYYCKNGSDSPTPSVGHKGDAGICPEGYYCPAGDSQSPRPCPVGTFNNLTHRSNINECVKCLEGHFCGKPALSSPSGICFAGYYCKRGSSLPNPSNTTQNGGPCPVGHRCPNGTVVPIPCLPGEYNPITRRDTCLPCPSQYFCPNASFETTECPVGYFCPNSSGSPEPCPIGTYKNYTKGSSLNECKLCPPGMFCPTAGQKEPQGLCAGGWYCRGGSWEEKPLNGSIFVNESACPLLGDTGGFCAKGTFCPPGSDQPRPCTPGYYCDQDYLYKESGLCSAGFYCNGSTINHKPSDLENGGICQPGYYCTEGSSYPAPCSPGTYAPEVGNQHRNECRTCDPGTYCGSHALDKPEGNCSEGYYCPSGETKKSPPDKECQPGHYCPEGAGLHKPCPPGSYQPYRRMGLCYVCPEGTFCDPAEARRNLSSGTNSSTHGVVLPLDCPPGYYCPNGTQTRWQHPCPLGTFGNKSKLSSVLECVPCSKGYYCKKAGVTQTTGLCYEGYYCTIRATLPNANITTEQGGPCPPGYYCIEGSYQAEPCPRGTYGPLPKRGRLSHCIDCPGGEYCSELGQTASNGSCSAGFYCSGRALKPNPVNESYGGVCPVGSYCPAGTATPFKCPPGTFNNLTSASESSFCLPCTPGKYCEGYGLSWPSGECDLGWFCSRGAHSKRPTLLTNLIYNNSLAFTCPAYLVNQTGNVCPVGSFCPRGSAQPQPCLPGMFCDKEGLSYPAGNCTAGYYCASGSNSSNPVMCQAGYYCPEGTPREEACPPGTFNSEVNKWSVMHCQNCTEGYYCPLTAMTEVVFKCLQGYYCPSGSTHNSTRECTLGNFCETGSPRPRPCSAGKYQDEPGQYKCKSCPEGYFCSPQGVITPSNCTAGNVNVNVLIQVLKISKLTTKYILYSTFYN